MYHSRRYNKYQASSPRERQGGNSLAKNAARTDRRGETKRSIIIHQEDKAPWKRQNVYIHIYIHIYVSIKSRNQGKLGRHEWRNYFTSSEVKAAQCLDILVTLIDSSTVPDAWVFKCGHLNSRHGAQSDSRGNTRL